MGFEMTIDGKPVESTETFAVVDPATEEIIDRAPNCSAETLDDAMRAASGALAEWDASGEGRRDGLRAAAERLRSGADDLAHTLTAEQGKPLADARWEVFGTAALFDYYADLDAQSSWVLEETESATVRLRRRPLGVVAAITAWNFPLALAARKVAPALLAGNTVVLKPSPYTPLSTLQMGSLLRDVFPPGVFNVVTGDDALGAWMTTHPAVRKITFTGSTATGKRIAEAAAPDLKRVTLELGGNDPAIVLDDADVATIAPALFRSGFVNSGQVCSCIKRVYAPANLCDELVEALVALARSVRVGNGFDEGVELGPINNEPQLERVMGLVDDAVAHGAVAAAGGSRIGERGYFYAPTILADATDEMAVVREEQFGPVLPIVRYDDLEDAIARANATMFGLDGSVWGADRERLAAVADRLECGTAWINTHQARTLDQPTAGFKWSGIGVESGPWGYEDLTQIQVLYEART